MARHYQPFSVSSLILLLSQALLIRATCYENDENHTAQAVTFTPCNQNTPFSMCLRTQGTTFSPPDAGCLPNGIALTGGDGLFFWRDGCTDPTWQSDYCLKAFNACPNDEFGNAQVTPCSGYDSSTTWCCGDGNTACCGQAVAITIAATVGPSFTSSSIVWSTTTLSTIVMQTITSTALSSVSPTSTSDRIALSIGAEAGIGVSVSFVGLTILGGIIWFVLRIRRRSKGNVDGSRHDMHFQRPELDGNSRGGWGSRGVPNVKEPQLRHALGGGTVLEL